MYKQNNKSRLAQVRKRLTYSDSEAEENFKRNDSNIKIKGRRAILLLLFLSLSVVGSKLMFANKEVITGAFSGVSSSITPLLNEQEWTKYNRSFQPLSLEVVNENLYSMYNTTSSRLQQFSWFLIPLLAGSGMTWVTWMIVYIDSSIPGVRPPTPFSPSKFRYQSGHTYHSGYIIAVVNGLLVFLLLMLNWNEVFGK